MCSYGTQIPASLRYRVKRDPKSFASPLKHCVPNHSTGVCRTRMCAILAVFSLRGCGQAISKCCIVSTFALWLVSGSHVYIVQTVSRKINGALWLGAAFSADGSKCFAAAPQHSGRRVGSVLLCRKETRQVACGVKHFIISPSPLLYAGTSHTTRS